MKKIWITFLLAGCVGTNWQMPADFVYVPIQTPDYEIATWQKISNPKNDKIHIYIEGDGNSFDSRGQPTDDPTPRGTFLRETVVQDGAENVVYVARPCQFIMSENCSQTDWTTGRFSQKIIDAESAVVKQIAGNKKVTLIGYSGGAMVSGLIIKQNPDLKVEKWVTIAGVLNHENWTSYFGDKPLSDSLDLDDLPKIAQVHFIGGKDDVVSPGLVTTWADAKNVKIVPNAKHDDFGDFKIFD